MHIMRATNTVFVVVLWCVVAQGKRCTLPLVHMEEVLSTIPYTCPANWTDAAATNGTYSNYNMSYCQYVAHEINTTCNLTSIWWCNATHINHTDCNLTNILGCDLTLLIEGEGGCRNVTNSTTTPLPGLLDMIRAHRVQLLWATYVSISVVLGCFAASVLIVNIMWPTFQGPISEDIRDASSHSAAPWCFFCLCVYNSIFKYSVRRVYRYVCRKYCWWLCCFKGNRNRVADASLARVEPRDPMDSFISRKQGKLHFNTMREQSGIHRLSGNSSPRQSYLSVGTIDSMLSTHVGASSHHSGDVLQNFTVDASSIVDEVSSHMD